MDRKRHQPICTHIKWKFLCKCKCEKQNRNFVYSWCCLFDMLFVFYFLPFSGLIKFFFFSFLNVMCVMLYGCKDNKIRKKRNPLFTIEVKKQKRFLPQDAKGIYVRLMYNWWLWIDTFSFFIFYYYFILFLNLLNICELFEVLGGTLLGWKNGSEIL